jgi:cytochrome b561
MRILHWIMAILILGMIGLGWYMTPYDESREPLVSKLYFLHKSFGIVIFILACVRLGIRKGSTIPALPETLPKFDRTLAHWTHVILYVLIFVMPILGYTLSSSYVDSDGVHFFFVDLPELIPKSNVVFKVSDLLHKVFGYTLLAIILLHICGALKHRFFDANKGNDVLPRML